MECRSKLYEPLQEFLVGSGACQPEFFPDFMRAEVLS